jgi:KDO2-lipid IV(A) lauroyltransferase
VRENLRCSFPEKSPEEILRIEKKFYRNLCDVFIEAFKCLNISDQEMLRRVEIRGCELPERIASEDKNVFMLLGHLGCWEWYQEVCVRYKAPKQSCEIYKQIENPYFASLMHEIRSRWNTTQIEMAQTVRTLLQWHAEGEPFLCGFIQDQRPNKKAKDGIMFLNQQTWYIPGAEEIARKANAELIYLDVEKPSRGHYRLTFREMIPNEEEANSRYPLSQNFWHKMEQTIQRQPELWLWSHNRWYKWELTK